MGTLTHSQGFFRHGRWKIIPAITMLAFMSFSTSGFVVTPSHSQPLAVRRANVFITAEDEAKAKWLAKLDAHSWGRAAQAILEDLREQDPERVLYALYTERLEAFMEHPPGPDWDGVFTHKTK